MCPRHLGENAESCDECRQAKIASSRRRSAIVATRKLLDAIHTERAELDLREAAAMERLKRLAFDDRDNA